MTTSNNNNRVFLIIVGSILSALILISIINANRTNVIQSSKSTAQVANEEVSSEQKSNIPEGNRNEHQYENTSILAESADVRSSIWGYFEWRGYDVSAVESFNHKDMNFWNSSGLPEWKIKEAYNFCESAYSMLGFGGITNVQIYLIKAEASSEHQEFLIQTLYQEGYANKWVIYSTVGILRLK